jgi:YD repeat-containing protein
MVAIVTSNGLGLFNSSSNLLGAGTGGQSGLGRLGEQLYVNGVTGNLIIQQQDDFIANTGLDIGVLRTYNSQGKLNDDNADNWRIGLYRSLAPATGTKNTAGSTVTRTNADGAETVYTYDTASGVYRSTDGDGAHDTLAYNATTKIWTWTDGSTRTTETYNSAGKLTAVRDTDGNAQTYVYTGNLLTSVTDASGQITYLDYTGTNLTKIRTVSQGVTQTRTYYSYDASNRLSQVTVDLTPGDNSIADGKVYTTTYTYDGTSKRVASITQGDGTAVTFHYDTLGRIDTVTDGLNQITRYTYNSTTRQTDVTNPLGLVTSYVYDTLGRLTDLYAPAVNGVRARTQFGYDSASNVTSVTDANGNVTAHSYDANGNLTLSRDAAGNTVTRTYSVTNQVLTETAYLVPDPDGAGAQTASVPVTTRYAYDAENHLRFTVSADGRVTEYVYNIPGQRIASIQYAGAFYNVTTLAPTAALTEATLSTWAGTQDKTKTLRTDYAYDFRGQLTNSTTYTSISTTGAGIIDGTQSQTQYVYDQAGKLLQTIEARGVATTFDTTDYVTTYTYDGLGRVLTTSQWTDYSVAPRTTVNLYDDVGNRVVTLQADGTTTTRLYNAIGALILQSDQATGASGEDLWQSQTFAVDAAGLTGTGLTDPAYMQVQGGRLVLGNPSATTWTWRYLIGADYNVQLGSSEYGGLTFRGEITLSASSAGRWAYLGADGGNSSGQGRSHYVEFTDNGQAKAWQLDAQGVWQSHVLGAVDNNATYVVEVVIQDGMSVLYLYKQGESRARGYIDQGLVHDWGAAHSLVGTYGGPGLTGNQSFVDNLSVSIPDNHSTDYTYDAAGQLLMVDSMMPQGQTYYLYDAAGRVVGNIDAKGGLTETVYDPAGNAVKQIRYATPSNYGLLYGANSQVVSTPIDTVRPAASSDDRITRTVYDQANRPVMVITPSDTDPLQGFVTQSFYDGAGRLTDVVRYSNPIALAGLTAAPVAADITARLTKSASSDRHSRRFYDQDNHDIADLDAEGYLTLQDYDAAGQPTHSVRYTMAATIFSAAPGVPDVVATQSLRDTGSLSAIKQAVLAQGANTNDQHTYTFYNAEGQVIGQLDADNYLTEYQYDLVGNLKKELRHAVRVAITFAGQTLAQLRPAVNPSDREVHYAYNGANQLTGVFRYPDNLATEYTYDVAGHLLVTTQYDIGDYYGSVRFTQRRLDAFGRVIRELSAEGGAALAALPPTATTADIEAVWNAYSIQHTYDYRSNLTSTTDVNGHTTYFYYDDNGRLRYRVRSAEDGSAELAHKGEVEEIVYDAFGEVKETVRYTTRIDMQNLIGDPANFRMFGAYIPDLRDKIITYSPTDTHVQTSYTLRGAIKKVLDGNQASTDYAYNSYSELLSKTQQIDATHSVTDTYTNDRRGLTVSTLRRGSDGLQVSASALYDAFGRVIASTDGRLNQRSTIYSHDAQGRLVVTTTDPGALNGNRHTTAYDAFGRVLYQVDALNQTTTYTYDETTHSLTITTPEGIQTTTQTDPFGQTVAITDGNRQTTTYAYDKNGRLTSVTDPQNHRTQHVYDHAGLERLSIDANGHVTVFSYDAANRLITHYVDPQTYTDANGQDINNTNGLDLSTTYSYDGQGRVLTQTDSNGVVTLTQYDNKGQVTSVTVDPSDNTIGYTGLNLVTLYSYDSVGHTLSVTQAAGTSSARTTKYVYDTLGRRIQEIVDPGTGHLNLTTAYSYDANNNVVTKTEGLGTAEARTTRYVYDANNRLVGHVDATGAVEKTEYDTEGRILRTSAYANLLNVNAVLTAAGYSVASIAAMTPEQLRTTLNSALTENTLSAGLSANATADHIIQHAYDKNGRLVYSIDALQYVTENVYDNAGNAIKRIAYNTALPVTNGTSADAIRAFYSAHQTAQDQVTRMAYDALNRGIYLVDALGDVTQKVFDNVGNVIQTNAYATALTAANLTALDSAPDRVGFITSNRVVDAAHDHTSRTVYDSANRAVYSIDALGNVTQTVYDAAGNARETIAYYDAINLATLTASPSTVDIFNALAARTATQPAKDQHTKFDYDNAGRLTGNTEAVGTPDVASEQYAYDAVGNKISFTNKNGDTWTYKYDAAGRLTEETTPATEVTRLTTDANGKPISVTTKESAVTRMTYDALGNVKTRTEGLGLRRDGSALRIESGSGSAGMAKVALDASGNAMAVWYQYDGTTYNIYASDYNISTQTWGAEQLIETLGGNVGAPQIIVDALGNAMAVWQQYDGNSYSIYANRYNASTQTWGAAQPIETNIGYAVSPRIAVDTHGNALVVWYQNDGVSANTYHIYANRFNADTQIWGTAQIIDTGAGPSTDPQIAFDAQGNAMVTWEQSNGTAFDIYANRYDASTHTWDSAQLIEGGVGTAVSPQIAMNTLGNAVVVWSQRDGYYTNYYANCYDAINKSWGTAQLVQPYINSPNCLPQIAIDAQGNAMAVWYQSDSDGTHIHANRYDAVTKIWGTAQLLETGAGYAAYDPQIAMDAKGNAQVVWWQVDSTNPVIYNIYANRYNASTQTWSTARLIETGAGAATSPQIAMDAQGNAVAIWSQQDTNVYGALNSIYVNRYNAATDSWEILDAEDARTTTYVYDAAGRQTQTILPAVGVYDASKDATNGVAARNETTQTPTTTTYYDAFGQAYANKDVNGNLSYKLYDLAGRVKYEIDAEGYTTEYSYDAFGNQLTLTRYADSYKSWETTQPIEPNTGRAIETSAGYASGSQIAFDPQGNAFSVWHQLDGANYSVYASRYDASTQTWDTPQLIETTSLNAASPQIVVDAQGNATVVWTQNESSFYSIHTNRYNASTHSWGAAQLIGSGTDTAMSPQLAVDTQGNILVVWNQSPGAFSDTSIKSIYACRFNASSQSWGAAQLIEASAISGFQPQIAIDSQGNATVAWVQEDGTIYANHYLASTQTWGTVGQIGVGDVASLQISADAQGNAIAVWIQNSSVYANRFSASSQTWGTAQMIEPVATGAQSPQIAMDALGNATVVWPQADPYIQNIYANRFNVSTQTWGAATLIESSTTGAAFSPQIAVDAQGNVMAVWVYNDGLSTNYSIYARRYNASTQIWNTAQLLQTGVGNPASLQIALDAKGIAMAVWSQGDGTNNQIYANRIVWPTTVNVLSDPALLAARLATQTNKRVITNTYDALNHLKETKQPAVYTYDNSANTALGEVAYFTEGPTTRNEYNAYGQLIRQRTLKNTKNNADPSQWTWIDTYYYYDAKGQKTATIDPVGYLTTYTYDAEGNQTRQVEYATALVVGNWSVRGYSAQGAPNLPTSPDQTPGASSIDFDRSTRYEYDSLNRKISETKEAVIYSELVNNTPQNRIGDLTTTYGYDHVGNLVSVTDSNLATTRTYYDALGRVTAVVEPTRSVNTVTGTSRATSIRELDSGLTSTNFTNGFTVWTSKKNSDRIKYYQTDYSLSAEWPSLVDLGPGDVDVTIEYTMRDRWYSPYDGSYTYGPTHQETRTVHLSAKDGMTGAAMSWSVTQYTANWVPDILQISRVTVSKYVDGKSMVVVDRSTNGKQTVQLIDKPAIANAQVTLTYWPVGITDPQQLAYQTRVVTMSDLQDRGDYYGFDVTDAWVGQYDYTISYTIPGESSAYYTGTGRFNITGTGHAGINTVGTVNANNQLILQGQVADIIGIQITSGAVPLPTLPPPTLQSDGSYAVALGTLARGHYTYKVVRTGNVVDTVQSSFDVTTSTAPGPLVVQEINGNIGGTYVRRIEIANLPPTVTASTQLTLSFHLMGDTGPDLIKVASYSGTPGLFYLNDDEMPIGEYEYTLSAVNNSTPVDLGTSAKGTLIIKRGAQSLAVASASVSNDDVTPLTTLDHDIFGNVVQQVRYARGAAYVGDASKNTKGYSVKLQDTLNDQHTYTEFDSFGHALWAADAEGNITNYSYTVSGNVAKEWHIHKDADNNTSNAVTLYAYDKLNQQIATTQILSQDTGAGLQIKIEAVYDAYGSIVRKGIRDPQSGLLPEQYEYDAAGRLWRTNQQDGVEKVYLYNLQGQATAEIRSQTLDLSVYASPSAVASLQAFTDVQRKESVYDVLGRVTRSIEPERYSDGLTGTVPNAAAGITPITNLTYDRWGNVRSVSDPRNAAWLTTYRYSFLNNVIEEKKPLVDVTGEDGVQASLAPITRYAYDKMGRLIGTLDANGIDLVTGLNYVNARWNTQHHDLAGQVVTEHHADGGEINNIFDALGRKVASIDANNKRTNYSYNRNNQLVKQRNALGEWEYYTYDEMGNRITASNGQVTGGVEEMSKYIYDTRGYLITTRTPLGQEVHSYYDAVGHKIRETHSAPSITNGSSDVTTWTTDYFGKLTTHTDIGGASYTYTYNKTNQLLTQTNTRGQSLTYSYYEDGKLKLIQDRGNAGGSLFLAWGDTSYDYDAAGNRTRERNTQLSKIDYVTWETYQDATVQYDALGRITHVNDIHANITYDYDAVGNRRHTNATYDDGTTTPPPAKDYWYTYDAMNRITTSQGRMNWSGSTGTIVIDSTQGIQLQYDGNGNRRVATQKDATGADVNEWYAYDDANRLTGTYRKVNDPVTGLPTNVYDSQRDYDPNGTGRVWKYRTFSALGVLTSEQTNTYNANGQLLLQTNTSYTGGTNYTVNYYSEASPTDQKGTYDAYGRPLSYRVMYGSVTNTYRTDLVKFESDKESSIAGSSTYFSSGNTNLAYDVNGNLVKVTDSNNLSHYRIFANNAEGQILQKLEFDNNSSIPTKRQFYDYINGVPIGTSGSLTNADFDYNYTPVSDNYPATSPSTYVANAGDTARSVALAVYGDAKLWYIIADANGLPDDVTTIPAGRTVTIPNVISNLHNDSTTFKPYNPGEIIGDTTPTLPDPPPPPQPKHGGCGVVGMIIMIVVAIVATIFTAGAALTVIAPGLAAAEGGIMAAGAMVLGGGLAGGGLLGAAVGLGIGLVAGAAGSIASQLVGMATGNVQKFSWGAVGVSALTAGFGASGALSAVTGAIGGATSGIGGGTQLGQAIINGAVNNAVGQGASMLVGQQKKFLWSNVAIGAVSAAASYGIDSAFGMTPTKEVGPFKSFNPSLDGRDFDWGHFARSVGSELTKSAARQEITILANKNGKMNWEQVAGDGFGNAIGNAIVDQMKYNNSSERWANKQFEQWGKDQQLIESDYKARQAFDAWDADMKAIDEERWANQQFDNRDKELAGLPWRSAAQGATAGSGLEMVARQPTGYGAGLIDAKPGDPYFGLGGPGGSGPEANSGDSLLHALHTVKELAKDTGDLATVAGAAVEGEINALEKSASPVLKNLEEMAHKLSWLGVAVSAVDEGTNVIKTGIETGDPVKTALTFGASATNVAGDYASVELAVTVGAEVGLATGPAAIVVSPALAVIFGVSAHYYYQDNVAPAVREGWTGNRND